MSRRRRPSGRCPRSSTGLKRVGTRTHGAVERASSTRISRRHSPIRRASTWHSESSSPFEPSCDRGGVELCSVRSWEPWRNSLPRGAAGAVCPIDTRGSGARRIFTPPPEAHRSSELPQPQSPPQRSWRARVRRTPPGRVLATSIPPAPGAQTSSSDLGVKKSRIRGPKRSDPGGQNESDLADR